MSPAIHVDFPLFILVLLVNLSPCTSRTFFVCLH